MIQKTKAYTTSDGTTFGSIDGAKRHELKLKFQTDNGAISPTVEAVIDVLVADPATFIEILKASEPKKRAPKKPKAKVDAKPAKAA